jgi:hypothetical protein
MAMQAAWNMYHGGNVSVHIALGCLSTEMAARRGNVRFSCLLETVYGPAEKVKKMVLQRFGHNLTRRTDEEGLWDWDPVESN